MNPSGRPSTATAPAASIETVRPGPPNPPTWRPAGWQGHPALQQLLGHRREVAQPAQSVDLVKSLITTDQQMAFADAFGVMPSTEEGAKAFAAKFPEQQAFVAGGQYAQGPVNLGGRK